MEFQLKILNGYLTKRFLSLYSFRSFVLGFFFLYPSIETKILTLVFTVNVGEDRLDRLTMLS